MNVSRVMSFLVHLALNSDDLSTLCFCRNSNTKVIVPIRNLKDTFVSFYLFMNSMARAHRKSSWADYFTYLLHAATGEI